MVAYTGVRAVGAKVVSALVCCVVEVRAVGAKVVSALVCCVVILGLEQWGLR